jgi:hypothetical protein
MLSNSTSQNGGKPGTNGKTAITRAKTKTGQRCAI